MSFNDSENYNKKEIKAIITKEFETTAKVSERTVQIAEAFGLGIDNAMKFTVYKNFPLGFNKDDIIYVTGDSGSGKSVILRAIKELIPNDYIDVDEIEKEINEEETIIEGIGKDLNEAVSILSTVGLNDAFLFLRKYNQLSDGQKFRYRIAKLIDRKKDFWVFDEFCAKLDRETAKIVSFNLQKIARRLNKGLIVATTHTDLKEDLSPSIYIYKKFNDEILTEYNPNEINKLCSIIKNLSFDKGTSADYEKLGKFHYRSHNLGGMKGVYTLRLSGTIIGLIVVTMPHLRLKGRSKYFNNDPNYTGSSTESLQLINKEFECISRVIVHPKYRAIGLAYYMLKEYFKISKSKYIETVAVMPKYNPFFEKAGMVLVNFDRYDKILETRKRRLQNIGLDLSLIKSKKYAEEMYNKLQDIEKEEFKNICLEQLKEYNGAKNDSKSFDNDLDLIKFCCDKFSYETEYLIYENPNFKEKNTGQMKLF